MEQLNKATPLSALMDVDPVLAPITEPTAASMPEIKQHPKTPPPSPPREGDSAPAPPTQSVAAQVPEPKQHLNTPIPQQHISAVRPTPKYATKTKTTSRADWVNTLWADISGQLRRFSVISPDLFDGLLLKKDTTTGMLILRDLVSPPCFTFNANANAVCAAPQIRRTPRGSESGNCPGCGPANPDGWGVAAAVDYQAS